MLSGDGGYSASSGASTGGASVGDSSIIFGSYGELKPFLPAWAWLILAVIAAFVFIVFIVKG